MNNSIIHIASIIKAGMLSIIAANADPAPAAAAVH